MLRTMMTDAQLRAQVQQNLDEWNENWGDRTAWGKVTAWTLAATLDAQAQVARSRYTIDRGHPAKDPFQLLRALGLITVRQIPSLVDGVAMIRQSVWLCHLCGWSSSTDVPAVSTFYAFLRRLYPKRGIATGPCADRRGADRHRGAVREKSPSPPPVGILPTAPLDMHSSGRGGRDDGSSNARKRAASRSASSAGRSSRAPLRVNDKFKIPNKDNSI